MRQTQWRQVLTVCHRHVCVLRQSDMPVPHPATAHSSQQSQCKALAAQARQATGRLSRGSMTPVCLCSIKVKKARCVKFTYTHVHTCPQAMSSGRNTSRRNRASKIVRLTHTWPYTQQSTHKMLHAALPMKTWYESSMLGSCKTQLVARSTAVLLKLV